MECRIRLLAFGRTSVVLGLTSLGVEAASKTAVLWPVIRSEQWSSDLKTHSLRFAELLVPTSHSNRGHRRISLFPAALAKTDFVIARIDSVAHAFHCLSRPSCRFPVGSQTYCRHRNQRPILKAELRLSATSMSICLTTQQTTNRSFRSRDSKAPTV